MEAYTDPTSPGFNPAIQPVMVFYPDGSNFTITLSQIDGHYDEIIQRTIIYSTQIGASIMVLVFMFVLTSREKARTFLFATNVLSLVLLFITALLRVLFLHSEWLNVYIFFGGDFTVLPDHAYNLSAALTVLDLLLEASVSLSLVLQVRAIFQNRPKWNLAVTLFTSFFAFLALVFGFAGAVNNLESNFALKKNKYIPIKYWISETWIALYTWSIICFCSIFIVKLAFAIRKRRQLGLKKFGALQAIFVVAMQTMILPSICLTMELCVHFTGLASYGSALIALQLPLSSLWAAARSTSETPTGLSGGRFSSGRSSNGSFDSQATVRSDVKFNPHHDTASTSSKQPMISDEGQELQAVRVYKSYDVNSSHI